MQQMPEVAGSIPAGASIRQKSRRGAMVARRKISDTTPRRDSLDITRRHTRLPVRSTWFCWFAPFPRRCGARPPHFPLWGRTLPITRERLAEISSGQPLVECPKHSDCRCGVHPRTELRATSPVATEVGTSSVSDAATLPTLRRILLVKGGRDGQQESVFKCEEFAA